MALILIECHFYANNFLCQEEAKLYLRIAELVAEVAASFKFEGGDHQFQLI